MSSESSQDGRLARAIEGDHEAIASLLAEAGAQARGWLGAQIPRRWRALLSADDVLQESYSEAFVKIRAFVPRRQTPFQAWFATIVRRNLLDAIRMLDAEKRAGRRQRSGSESNGGSADMLADLLSTSTRTSPSRAAARAEFHDLLQRALADLPDPARQLVQMYDLEERPVTEVAAALGCTSGAVYVRRGRIHRRLRELLGPTTGLFTDAV
jgi:RNA polymerase sigma-70 factor, ECF subfamily